MSYAVIESGGKQYRVSSGDVVALEKLPEAAGETVKLDKVLLIRDKDRTTVGTPTIPGASVSGEVVAHGKDRKVIVFKKKRRKNYRRTRGHRQAHTQIRITGIEAGTGAA
jgi:large subunit ribosomal protein L21